MRSIYEEMLGKEFENLHPRIQERFGFSSKHGIAAIGKGVMEKVWHGPFFTYPFLCLGSFRRIMFPEQGENVPFTIENYAYLDSFGRETVTWIRTFKAKRTRRFDAYMIHSAPRNCIVDYLGTHQHLAVDLHLGIATNGGLRIRSGEQRFYEHFVGFRFPMIFSGVADVCEWFDDERGKFGIEVSVSNSRWGKLFGYSGLFDVEWIDLASGEVPAHIRPRREERRE
ncbi:MAG: DUF4166 domain-containing protein [Fimbriimonas ginsengisoli]|uniref:DUF4166 domain-containing protein n=1 Tax=Fimbriimonas ginsengisoli TaxID=1005039 RepID=A0A931PTR6_FIMGI|nr:DUF4166 domain-containing protein [Fimbriimonas ginsengisoli]